MWDQVEDERRAIADLLDDLSADEADTESLCAGWRIRDVAGHLYWIATSTPADVIRDFLVAGARTNVMMDTHAIASGSMPVDELAAKLRSAAGSTRRTPGFAPIGYLADVVVHHQDMLRPLGRTRSIAEDRLVAVLDHTLASNRFTRAKRRVRGLHLNATDLDWATGSGAEVEGPAEAILMAAVGRSAALTDLAGEGVSILAGR